MLTTREAALRLGVSLRTVQLWVEADILPAARTPGGHRRIPYNAVEALALSTGLGGEPLARGSLSKRDIVHQSGFVASPPAHAFDGLHVARAMEGLLVADDPEWQMRCERSLLPYGPSVMLRMAETGYLALLQIGQHAPDLLITNLALPGMDGMAMLRTLDRCESIAGMRILVLYEPEDEGLARRGGLPESVEFIRRPVPPEAIAVRVGRQLLGQVAS
jgi:excisionase family DNA binding protein